MHAGRDKMSRPIFLDFFQKDLDKSGGAWYDTITLEQVLKCSNEKTTETQGEKRMDKTKAEHRDALCGLEEEELFEMAELFKVFGDSTRIRILYAMFRQEMNVTDLCEALGLSISAISHQLRLLKQAKLVRSRREGRMVYYMLADEHVKTIIGMAKEHIEE